MLEQSEIERWRRMTAAMLRHAAADDPAAMRQVADVLTEAVDNLPYVAEALRAQTSDGAGTGAGGYSWTDIAAAFGITRQGARKRFGGKA